MLFLLKHISMLLAIVAVYTKIKQQETTKKRKIKNGKLGDR